MDLQPLMDAWSDLGIHITRFPNAIFVTAPSAQVARLIHKGWCDFCGDRARSGVKIHIKINDEDDLYNYIGTNIMGATALQVAERTQLSPSVTNALSFCSGFSQYVVDRENTIIALRSGAFSRFNSIECVGKTLLSLESQIHEWRVPIVEKCFSSRETQSGERTFVDSSHTVLREWRFVEKFYPIDDDLCIIDVADPPDARGLFQASLW